MRSIKDCYITVRVVALRYQVLDNVDDTECFCYRCIEGIMKNVASDIVVSSEGVLFLSFCVSGDDLLCGAQNLLTTPVVIVQCEGRWVKVGSEILNILWIRPTPTVDRLIFVSDYHQVPFRWWAEQLE